MGTAGRLLLLVLSVSISHGHVDETGQVRDEGLVAREEAWSKCERARARQARAILNEEVYPVVEKRSYQLPSSCPLARQQDMYLDNELHKKEVRYQNWRCTYCNKVFKAEHFLERHFEHRHPYTIMRDGVCLADYCETLACDLNLPEGGGLLGGSQSGCSQKLMQRRRHKCQSVVDACFPPHHSNLANELHHYFEELYCSHLVCNEVGHSLVAAPLPATLLKSAARRKGANKDELRAGGWKKLYVVLGVLFSLILVIFYLGMCLYRKDISIVADLRKLSNSKRKKRLELLKAKQF